MKPVVVIPTYEEADALAAILDAVMRLAPGFRVLVVDDNSPDGTGEIADRYAARHPRVIAVLHRPAKTGIGTAYCDGFRRVLGEGADPVFEMDADHSHNPRYLPVMLEALRAGADVVVGSRYRNGVRVENWPFRRLMLSRFANAYVNYVTGMPMTTVSDATSGFRGYRAAVLRTIDLDKVGSNGYSFQIEMAYRAWRMGFRVQEVPITFEEHYLSSSKITRRIVWEAAWRTPLLRLRVPRGRPARGPESPSADAAPVVETDRSG